MVDDDGIQPLSNHGIIIHCEELVGNYYASNDNDNDDWMPIDHNHMDNDPTLP